MADEVTIHEAKTHLSRLVQRAHDGEEIVIRRGKVPMAKLVRYDAAPVPRTPGRLRGQIEMAPDFEISTTRSATSSASGRDGRARGHARAVVVAGG